MALIFWVGSSLVATISIINSLNSLANLGSSYRFSFLKSSGYFTEMKLSKWDILFKEWDRDDNLYIIYDGELSVQRSIETKKWSFKELSLIWIWNIVWEAALSHSEPKEVQIVANRNSILLKIEGKTDFPKYVSAYPKDAYEVLTTVISIANSRLLRSNRQLTANYEVNVAISKIKDISITSIYKLLLVFQSILQVDQIMYFEKNRVMDSYYKLRYDSKNKSAIQNKILKFENETLDFDILKQEWIELSRYIRSTDLSLWEEHYWFLVIGKEKKDFHENEEQLLTNTAWSFVGIIHQKWLIDEARNKNYIKSAL